MKLQSEVVIGNAMLSALESRVFEMDYEFFTRFQERLNEKIEAQNHSEQIRPRATISMCDIFDTVSCFSPYCNFENLDVAPYFLLSVYEKKASEFKDLLDIYYRKISPKWLIESLPEYHEI
jgi:hypothetical protein